jgi:glyoxylase-like metal-dependent hydrolase (beta-lactamase superfamily II)
VESINEFYRFRVGRLDCICASDGSNDYTLGSFFTGVPHEQVKEALAARGQPVSEIITPYTNLVVETAGHRVLIDAGAGHLAETTGRLPRSLRAAGIPPESIDTIIITHAHPDHIGGLLDQHGNLVFPDARYFIWPAETRYWNGDENLPSWPAAMIDAIRHTLATIDDRTSPISFDAELLPGISAIPTPGHTPGHVAVSVQSDGEELLYISDAVLHPLHLEHPAWRPVFDRLPEQAEGSKRMLFDRAADRGSLVIGQHFAPFPSIGRVKHQGDGWRWEPVA